MLSRSTSRERTWFMLLVLVAATLLAGCRRPGASVEVTPASPDRPITAPKAQFHSKDPGYTNWWHAWSTNVHVGGYLRGGKRDPSWDDAVIAALQEYAYHRVYQVASPGTPPARIRDQLKEARNAGCTDAFVEYLYARLIGKVPETATLETAADYGRWAREVANSRYPSFLKFFVNLRAAEAYRAASTNQVPEVLAFRNAASVHLERILLEEEIPAHAAYDACLELYQALSRNPQHRAQFQARTEPVLQQRWPDEGFRFALSGRFYVDYAWDGRGNDWAPKVTDEGWRLFEERLRLAEAALNRAWELDPTLPETPLAMMQVGLGQVQGRDRLELWFERAIAFPDDRYRAVDLKLWYLQPRWHGTEKECLAAARGVLKSDLFQGETPLHLYHTHESLAKYYGDQRPNYWTEPQVWPDLKAAFDRYFSFPGARNGWRHNFVRCAARCEQWQVVNDEIPKLGRVNYEYFGGREAFERLQTKARDKAARATSRGDSPVIPGSNEGGPR